METRLTPTIFFDGQNVMLCPDGDKKKAIRVENVTVLKGPRAMPVYIQLNGASLFDDGISVDEVAQLPEGYTYEVINPNKDGFLSCCVMGMQCECDRRTVIIKPVVVLPEEGEDELWNDVSSYYANLNALTVHTMPHPKSKYKLNRR